jgi:hypothetical protein
MNFDWTTSFHDINIFYGFPLSPASTFRQAMAATVKSIPTTFYVSHAI